jgi:hypothetical protein
MENAIASSRIVLASLAAGFVCALLSVPAAAQGTPEQRAACQDDAQRLCGQFIPDVDRITACMVANRRYVSRRCRLSMEAGRRRTRASD